MAQEFCYSLELSPDLAAKLELLADQVSGSKSDVLRKAIALMEVAVRARDEGKRFGVAKSDQELETEIVGVSQYEARTSVLEQAGGDADISQADLDAIYANWDGERPLNLEADGSVDAVPFLERLERSRERQLRETGWADLSMDDEAPKLVRLDAIVAFYGRKDGVLVVELIGGQTMHASPDVLERLLSAFRAEHARQKRTPPLKEQT